MWARSEAGVVATAFHLIRPPSTSELLAWTVQQRSSDPLGLTHFRNEGQQVGFFEYRPKEPSSRSNRTKSSSHPDASPAEPVGETPPTPFPPTPAQVPAPGTPGTPVPIQGIPRGVPRSSDAPPDAVPAPALPEVPQDMFSEDSGPDSQAGNLIPSF